MASTVTLDSGVDGRSVAGDCYVRRGVLNLGTYATGGIAVTKAQLDLPVKVRDLDIKPSAGYVFEYLPATGLVKAFYDNSAASYTQNVANGEVANAANLTAITPRFEAKGI